ncbi:CdaR family protein [Paenibacillus campinasensis]|uniref:YbbR-like domain-containing protein n=1 Tax=Paenibacillus campinasensis TaxID=66347 RepID=A0A268EEL6_9BACL|nr:CdaR family protein [Paenibacillus campinasensis]MUG67064.1 hypothetical protein [Paenibacillus campinasensis]PAD71555.1 hypothetical protein CHH67_24115 [Paenibacillus campinasensis]
MDKWINNNNVSKLIALAVSVLLWAMVHMDNGTPAPPTTFIDTRLIEGVQIQTFGFDDSHYALTGIDKDRVDLEVRGKLSQIRLVKDEYKVRLDLSGVKEPGTHTLPLTYSVPSGVELVSMEPSQVTVTVEKRVTRSVTVSIGTTGEPAKDYRAGTPMLIEPRQVTVTLPESEMEQLGEVKGFINLDGADETVTEKRIRLTAYDKLGNPMEDAVIEPSTVAAEVPVEPAFVSVPLDVDYTGRLPDHLVLSKVESKVKEVRLFGNQEALAGAEDYFRVTIDLGKITNSGTTVLTTDLTPPVGFEKIEPSSVDVEVTVVAHEEKVIDGIPIVLNGVPAGLEAAIREPRSQSISLEVAGAPDILRGLGPADIQAEADLSGMSAGVHEVPLQISLPDFVMRTDQERVTVQVELKEKSTPASTKPDQQGAEADQTEAEKQDPPAVPEGPPQAPPADSGEGSGSDEGTVRPPAEGTEEPETKPGDGTGEGQ